MISNKGYASTIDTFQVNDTFNKRYRWQKYNSVYHSGTTYYYWNKYNVVRKDPTYTYHWNRYSIEYAFSDYASSSIHVVNFGSTVSAGTGFTKNQYPANPFSLTGLTNITITNNSNASQLNGKYISASGTIKYISRAQNFASDGVGYTVNRIYEATKKQGATSYGEITSSSSTAYPNNGISGSYWYKYTKRSEIPGEITKGTTSYGTVSSTSRSAYPDNSYSGDYWYVYSRSSTSSAYYSKGAYIEDVVAKEEDEYPTNGRHTDGYWYVKIE